MITKKTTHASESRLFPPKKKDPASLESFELQRLGSKLDELVGTNPDLYKRAVYRATFILGYAKARDDARNTLPPKLTPLPSLSNLNGYSEVLCRLYHKGYNFHAPIRKLTNQRTPIDYQI